MAANSLRARPAHGFTYEILAPARSSLKSSVGIETSISSPARVSLDILLDDQLRPQLQIRRSSGFSLLMYTTNPRRGQAEVADKVRDTCFSFRTDTPRFAVVKSLELFCALLGYNRVSFGTRLLSFIHSVLHFHG